MAFDRGLHGAGDGILWHSQTAERDGHKDALGTLEARQKNDRRVVRQRRSKHRIEEEEMNSLSAIEIQDLEEEFRLRYLRSICDLNLNYARRRNTAEGATRLQQWLRSTFQKDAFAWAVVHAKCVRQPASQSELMAMTKISRQSISEMIKHCLAEGWVEVFCGDRKIGEKDVKHCKGSLKYQAGDELMQLGQSFIDRHIETTKDTFMNSNWDDLMAIRKVRAAIL